MGEIKRNAKRLLPGLVPAIQSARAFLNRPMPLRVAKSNVAVFARVYDSNYWGNTESRSGNGSDLKQTAEIRVRLPELFRGLQIRSVLDIPCGDFFWMREVDLGEVRYIGGDIVKTLIDELSRRHANEKRSFRHLDLTMDELPRSDLIFCRDALVHMSFDDVRRAIANMKRSGSQYLLTTTFTGRDRNLNISTSGDWRPLNLQKAPFSFPAPMRLIDEKCTEHFNQFADKSLALWRLADL